MFSKVFICDESSSDHEQTIQNESLNDNVDNDDEVLVIE